MAERFFETRIVGGTQPPETKPLTDFVPTLFIGLGGSGKDALMRLRRRFHDEYNVPRTEFARFLVLDTNMSTQTPDEEPAERYAPVKLEPTEFVDCQISEGQFERVFDCLRYESDPRFTGWLKPQMQQYGAESVADGAGTHRQFGRMAFFLNYDDIRAAIERHVDAALSYAATTPENVLDTGGGVLPNRLEVVLVCSLAGGTGSGMLIDTAYLVKDVLTSPRYEILDSKYTTLACFMPTLFKEKAKQLYKRFQQNAYASLLELEYYGTPRTGDELFLGQSSNPDVTRNRVGFRPAWKPKTGGKDNFIAGAGWEACYLVDNANALTMNNALTCRETFQMAADYLFLDFQRTEFAVAKRSARSNLVQFRDRRKETIVWKLALDAEEDDLRQGRDVLFATHNGCTFSSFGLAEIAFDKGRVYRAAGYRLAMHLVRQHWLGDAARVRQSTFNQWASDDLFQPAPDDPHRLSFMPDELIDRLYDHDRGNWLSAAGKEVDAARDVHFTMGLDVLREVLKKHQAAAHETMEEQLAAMSGDTRRLGPYRARLAELARRRLDRHGVAVTLQLLQSYRKGLHDISMAVQQHAGWEPRPAAELLARLEQAGSIGFPSRKLAQQIEFPLACDEVAGQVTGVYRRAAAPRVQELMNALSRYVGAENQKPDADLTNIGTLHAHYQKAADMLGSVSRRLEERFTRCCDEEGNERKQSLFPATWDEATYDEKLNRSLLDIGRAETPIGPLEFDLARLESLVLAKLKEEPGYEEARSISDLIDQWFDNKDDTEDGVQRVAEAMAAAAKRVLEQQGLDLEEYADGNVIDLLYNEHKEETRENLFQKLVRTSAPYLPRGAELESETGFRPEFRNTLGRKAGDKPYSADREKELTEQIKNASASVRGGIDGDIHQVLDANKSSIVYCREVCGTPLQYYAYLEQLHDAYHDRTHGSDRTVDECHISYHEAWEDLPDIRNVPPETYALIRDHVDLVLFAMIIGEIECKEGVFSVKVRDEHMGTDRVRLGTRINRIIKHACEKASVRKHLQRRRDRWVQDASPRDWAAVFLSAQQTYFESRTQLRAEGQNYSSPLRNCFDLLLRAIKRELLSAEEGRRWHAFLRLPNEDDDDDYEEKLGKHEQIFDLVLNEDKILERVSESIPVYQVNKNNLHRLQLPAEKSGPAKVKSFDPL